MKQVKHFGRSILNKIGLDIRRVPKDATNLTHGFSNLDEQAIIAEFLGQLKPLRNFCVDIGASDGVNMSNTYALFRSGCEGLAIEYDGKKFSNLAYTYKKFPGVNLAKCKATPENICALLEGNQTPIDFCFLNLDIDGYDYFVLEQILGKFRPSLICTEINEKIPPPVKFTVNWDPDYTWATDHFYGQSIAQLSILCTQFHYSLVKLHYNNAFLMPSEIAGFPSLTAEEAYREGYLEKPDRKLKFPWNANMEALLTLEPEEALKWVDAYFQEYAGKFVCSI